MIANLMAVSPVTSTVCSHDRGGKLQLSRIFEPSLGFPSKSL